MDKTAILLACVVFAGHGRRLQTTAGSLGPSQEVENAYNSKSNCQSTLQDVLDPLQAFAILLQALHMGGAFNPSSLRRTHPAGGRIVGRRKHVSRSIPARFTPVRVAMAENAAADGSLQRLKTVYENCANNVALRPLAYLLVLPLQSVALVQEPWSQLVYFMTFVTLTVDLGATAKPIRTGQSQPLTMKQAMLAPVAAGAFLFGLYALIKFFLFDPNSIYRIGVCSLGLVALSDIAVQAIAAATRDDAQMPLPATETALPGNESAQEPPPLFSSKERVAASALSLAIVGDYLINFWQRGSASLDSWHVVEQNLIAWALAMFSIATVSLRTFKTAAVFSGGLLLYDIFSVFSSDIMTTVSTKIDAPVKLIAEREPGASFPFALLGLGDVAIPAFFCALMAQFDDALASGSVAPESDSSATLPPYRQNAVLAYAVGLAGAFWANQNLRRGQPALLYLVPAVLLSSLMTAWERGELRQLWEFEVPVTANRIPLDLMVLSEEQRNPVE